MFRIMSLAYLLEAWRPGSEDWNWVDELMDVLRRECLCCGRAGHYQDALRDYMEDEGAWWMTSNDPLDWPILGNDGRVWDGHHRILAAMWLEWKVLPVYLWPEERNFHFTRIP